MQCHDICARYLENLWNDNTKFLAVYKQGATVATGMGGCSAATRRNQTDAGCCCIREGSRLLTGHYENFTLCPPSSVYDRPASPGNVSQCFSIGPGSHAQTCTVPGQTCGADRHSSLWPCDETVTVRELLALGPPYYFGITPKQPHGGATKFDGMWETLFDGNAGFWAEFGPTTVERGATCFNHSQDTEECNWAWTTNAAHRRRRAQLTPIRPAISRILAHSTPTARAHKRHSAHNTQAGPSWPYETSRVLTGLSNFLTEYPPSQSAAAGMDSSKYTKLLHTYARSMTRGYATNGSVPWVGENIEPDAGYWIAHSIQYVCV